VLPGELEERIEQLIGIAALIGQRAAVRQKGRTRLLERAVCLLQSTRAARIALHRKKRKHNAV
jgi:hypothetical protein